MIDLADQVRQTGYMAIHFVNGVVLSEDWQNNRKTLSVLRAMSRYRRRGRGRALCRGSTSMADDSRRTDSTRRENARSYRVCPLVLTQA